MLAVILEMKVEMGLEMTLIELGLWAVALILLVVILYTVMIIPKSDSELEMEMKNRNGNGIPKGLEDLPFESRDRRIDFASPEVRKLWEKDK